MISNIDCGTWQRRRDKGAKNSSSQNHNRWTALAFFRSMVVGGHLQEKISGEYKRMTDPCSHARTQVVSKDENGQFVECLDCKEIFETSELEDTEPKENLKEDLSDA